MNLSFLRVNSLSTLPTGTTISQGSVIFDKEASGIYVAENDNDFVCYSGKVTDASWDATTSKLTISKIDGNIVLDFSDVATASGVTSLLAPLRTDINNLQSATGIADGATRVTFTDTSYLNGTGIDVSTLYDALVKLDHAIYEASENAGVTSFGGAKGSISVDTTTTTDGEVKFTMDGSTLKAEVVGIDTAAYKAEEYFIGETTDTSVNDTIKGAKKYADAIVEDLDASVGNLTTLTTDAKTTLVAAINEIDDHADKADASIQAMTGTATIASKDASDIVTIKVGIEQADGIISNTSGTDITLSKVAVTGTAADVTIVDASSKITATNVEDALTELVKRIDVAEGGMRYNGVLDSSIASLNTLTNTIKAGDTYLASGEFTIGTGDNAVSVEIGDMIIYKGADVDAATTLTTSNCNVIERESDVMVTADGTLTSDYVVIGGGNKTVKSTSVDISSLEDAIGYANSAVQTVSHGTDGSFITIDVNTDGGTSGDKQVTINGSLTKAVISATLDPSIGGVLTTDNIQTIKEYADSVAADTVQSVTGETAITDSNYINVAVTASTDASNAVTLSTTANVETQDVSTASSSSDGLATAYNVQDYVKAYVNAQLVWTMF